MVKVEESKYYPAFRDVWKQLPMLFPMVLISAVTGLYASGLHNQTTRTIGYSLAFLLFALMVTIIIFSLLSSIPKFNYFQLDSDGVHSTILGLIHKHIYWSDIERIDKTHIGNIEGVGMMYKSSFHRYVWGRKSRRKIFGWDEMLAGAYRADGASLADDAAKQFNKYSGRIGG